MKLHLPGLYPEEIASAMGLKPFQGRQVFRWVHAKQVFDFDAMTDISKADRLRLKEGADASRLELADTASSPDRDARKALFRLADGETIEAVWLRDGKRITLCLSTQAGCPLDCRFCATGQSGFVRNLGAGEIAEQALQLIRAFGPGDDPAAPGDARTPNIVFMGMGEPFLNYESVLKSVRLLMRQEGLGIGARKITVSTAGEVPGIARFAEEDLQVRLSVSLHAANDRKRSELVPLNRKYPLAALMDAVNTYTDRTGRQVTFEWVLMAGVNDTIEDARELAGLARKTNAVVNLIPFNKVEGSGWEAPSREQCAAFQGELERLGVKSTMRRERGGDIEAACGQLRRRSAQSP